MRKDVIIFSLLVNKDMINNSMHRNDKNTITILYKRRKQLIKLLADDCDKN